jgi:predicted dehydrogenase
LKAALIGAGNIGVVHSKAYKDIEDVSVVAVVDIDAEKARKIAADHGARAYSTLDEMMRNESPDFVDICTPTYTHEEIALKVMEKKLHVLCEKPLALNYQSAKKIVESSEKNGVIFMVAQVIRFWPEYEYLKKMSDEGSYGNILYANFTRKCQAPGKDIWFADSSKSGGAVLDFHIHDADFVMYLMGEPDKVESETFLYCPSHDYMRTRYIYSNNVLVEAEGGWIDYPIPFEMFYRVVFEKAILEYKNSKLVLYPRRGSFPEEITSDDIKNYINRVDFSSTNGYYNEIKYFTECIKKGMKAEKVAPRQSLSCMKMILDQMEKMTANDAASEEK